MSASAALATTALQGKGLQLVPSRVSGCFPSTDRGQCSRRDRGQAELPAGATIGTMQRVTATPEAQTLPTLKDLSGLVMWRLKSGGFQIKSHYRQFSSGTLFVEPSSDSDGSCLEAHIIGTSRPQAC